MPARRHFLVDRGSGMHPQKSSERCNAHGGGRRWRSEAFLSGAAFFRHTVGPPPKVVGLSAAVPSGRDGAFDPPEDATGDGAAQLPFTAHSSACRAEALNMIKTEDAVCASASVPLGPVGLRGGQLEAGGRVGWGGPVGRQRHLQVVRKGRAAESRGLGRGSKSIAASKARTTRRTPTPT